MPEGGTMEDAEMDRILSKQDEILPSSGFTASVMEAVRREAAAPPPIPFPWKRALPVLALAACALAGVVTAGIWAITDLSHAPLSPQWTASQFMTLPPIWQGTIGAAVGWTALALLTAFVSVKLSMHLAGGRA